MNGLYSDMLYIEDSTFSFLVIRPMEYLRRGILCAQLLWKKSCRIRYIIYIWTMIQKEIL